MRRVFTVFVLLSLSAHMASAEEPLSIEITSGVLAIGTTTYQSALARADVALAKSIITPSVLRGEVGEAIRDQRVMHYSHRSGKWLDVSPRLGPQGLDHVSVQLDQNSSPYRLMVDETKFGSAQLLRTVRGDIQMGDRYVSERLEGLAKRYKTIALEARTSSMPAARVPQELSTKRIMTVPLSDTESVRFWRPASGAGPWHFDGPAEAMPRAIQQLDRLARLHESAATGNISYSKRIFQVKPEGDALAVIIRDAANVDAVRGNLSKLPIKARITTPSRGALSDAAIVETKLADELRRQMPHLDTHESRSLARGVQQSAGAMMEETLSRRSFAHYAAFESVKVGGLAMLIALPLEMGTTLLSGGTPDWARTANMAVLTGASSLAGNTAGNATSYAILNSPYGYTATKRISEIAGLRSAGRFANLTGGIVGGGITGALLLYGGYWLGYYDLQTANRLTVAGLAGTGAAAAASATALALISTHGVAGTGVAISSLSGAATTNATLAWAGGGTLVSGGTGVLGGTVIIGTGAGIVAVGIATTTMYAFHLWDEHQDNIRLMNMLNYLSTRNTFVYPQS